MIPHTCNESVFSRPLCSSDERRTSLYISAASTNSPAGDKRISCPAWLVMRWNCRNNLTYQYKKQQRWDHASCFGLNFFPWETGAKRAGVLYLWWCEFQPSRWVRTPAVCELLRTPLDISSARTWGAPPLSWCWKTRNTLKSRLLRLGELKINTNASY